MKFEMARDHIGWNKLPGEIELRNKREFLKGGKERPKRRKENVYRD